jgi:hypothetical protein
MLHRRLLLVTNNDVAMSGKFTAVVSDVLTEATTIELLLVRYGAHSFAGICQANYNREVPPYRKGATAVNSAGQLIVNGKPSYSQHKDFRADGTRITLCYDPAKEQGCLRWRINGVEQSPIVRSNPTRANVCFCVGGSSAEMVQWRILPQQ